MIDIGPHLLGCNPHVPHPDDADLAEHLKRLGVPEEVDPLGQITDLIDRDLAFILAFISKFGPAPRPGPAPAVTNRAWADYATLNQGRSVHCVGNGWAGWEACLPVADPNVTEATAASIYYAAKIIDGQPGQENGSQVRSGAEVMRARGRLVKVAYTQDVETVLAWVDNYGPVVLGTEWTQAMFTPTRDGYINPLGAVMGGHCYLGHAVENGALRIRNSWGAGWGMSGDALIDSHDLASLLSRPGGVACAAVELPLPASVPQARADAIDVPVGRALGRSPVERDASHSDESADREDAA